MRKHWWLMNYHHLTSAALMALALAACSRTADTNAVAAPNVVEAIPPSESVDPVNNQVAAGNEMTSTGNSAAPAKLPTATPTQFQGRWGLNKADCTSTKGDAKGLLTISDALLTFYESRGTLGKVLGATANSFDARYSFAGEGQTWARTERLKLADGKLNRRTDAEPDQEPPVNLTYSRCAN